VCQVYKGEIEEKLLNGCCQPLNAAHYLQALRQRQVFSPMFCIKWNILDKNTQKRKIRKVSERYFLLLFSFLY
jgi:hypothetical protein